MYETQGLTPRNGRDSRSRRRRECRRRTLRLELLENRRVLTTESAELSFQFFAVNSDGSTGRNLDPDPSDSVLVANVAVGEKFLVRTLVKDLRQPNPQGVFSVYSDLIYSNVNGSPSEKVQLQWGEYNLITMDIDALEGTFQLQYGDQITADIPLETLVIDGIKVHDREATAANIADAISALPNVGPGNVSVRTGAENRFDVSFRNARARSDMPDPVVINNQVTTGGPNPTSVSVVATGTPNANALSAYALESAINRSPDLSTPYRYSSGGRVGNTIDMTGLGAGQLALKGVGGFLLIGTPIPSAIASQFLAASDLVFVASSAGQVQFESRIADVSPDPGQNVGIALLGAGPSRYLTASEVILPTAMVTISDGIVANSDQAFVFEDSFSSFLNVLANDLDPSGTSRSIVAVSQPSVGGSVEITPDGSAIRFTPAINFFGTAELTYTVRNNLGFEAVGSVTVSVSPVNDPPMLNSLPNLSVSKNVTTQSVALTGISSGPGELQNLQIRVSSSNPSLIPTPTVSYQSPEQNGTLSFTPVFNQTGTSIITVTVEDSGGLQASQMFVVSVLDTPGSFQNPANAFDVDDDGRVSSLDVLYLRNLLNTNGPSISVDNLNSVRPFFDVDGDDFITPLDTLKVTDYLNFGGPFEGAEGTVELAIGLFGLDGSNLDPTPNDSINEAVVTHGQRFIVRTFVKDLRIAPQGVYSVYSNLDFTNLDASADARLQYDQTEMSFDYREAPSGRLVDLTSTTPGRRRLENLGGSSSSMDSELAGTFRRVYDTLFTPLLAGEVEISHSPASTASEKLGIAMFASTGRYLPNNSVVFPTAKITVLKGLIATNDNFSIVEGGVDYPLNVLANDIDTDGNAFEVIAVSPPAVGGSVNIASDGFSLRFSPATEFSGVASFTYTIRNSAGDQANGTVTVNVISVNDPPTLNPIANVVVERNAPIQSVPLTGISAGPNETQPLSIKVTSSNVALIPIPVVDYLDPSTSGSLRFTPSANKFGSSEISVSVEDADGSTFERTFTITVTAPSGGYQNPVTPLDVNSDGFVSPIDYLVISNLLNQKGPATSVVGLSGPAPFYDVNGDDFVTPLDLLKIADFLNASPSSSTTTPLVKMEYGFFATDGRNLDPNPDDDQSEAIVLPGEQFVVRTFIQDLRTDARGVFSVYSDFNYTNEDKSATEKMVYEFTSSSQIYSSGVSNETVDATSTTPGKRVLRDIGRTANQFRFESDDASRTLVAFDTQFTAQEIGVILVSQSLSSSASNLLGISVLGGTGRYLTQEQVILPTGKITIREGVGVQSATSHWASPSMPTKSTFVVDALKSGFVDAWVDFNRDGEWQALEDRVLSRIPVVAGKNIIPFTVPASMSLGERNARFLLTSNGASAATATLAPGEYSNDLTVTLEGGSLSSPKIQVDELGAHEIIIEDELVQIKVAGNIVWSVPASELPKLSSVKRNGDLVSELRDFSSAFPGVISYKQESGKVELEVATSTLNLGVYGISNLQGVQTIDLRQTGANVLVVQAGDVAGINSERRLQVVLNKDDSLATNSAWRFETGRVENGAWIQPYSEVDPVTGVTKTLEVVSERPWRNEVSRLDSNGDGLVSPLDVLLLINGVNNAIFVDGRLPPRTPANGDGFYDVDGDSFLGPLDVLSVIDKINSRGNGEGEHSQSTDQIFSMMSAHADAEEWLARLRGNKTTRK